jgi:hypothetical protein
MRLTRTYCSCERPGAGVRQSKGSRLCFKAYGAGLAALKCKIKAIPVRIAMGTEYPINFFGAVLAPDWRYNRHGNGAAAPCVPNIFS